MKLSSTNKIWSFIKLHLKIQFFYYRAKIVVSDSQMVHIELHSIYLDTLPIFLSDVPTCQLPADSVSLILFFFYYFSWKKILLDSIDWFYKEWQYVFQTKSDKKKIPDFLTGSEKTCKVFYAPNQHFLPAHADMQ